MPNFDIEEITPDRQLMFTTTARIILICMEGSHGYLLPQDPKINIKNAFPEVGIIRIEVDFDQGPLVLLTFCTFPNVGMLCEELLDARINFRRWGSEDELLGEDELVPIFNEARENNIHNCPNIIKDKQLISALMRAKLVGIYPL
ncbi:MAG: hypothetical protein IH845_00775 [Nanoarchaeota archaeon]|nr:hypothetical protein [Nanoarchaeota archaeon]